MNILLTNDDGVMAPGIWAAAQVLSNWGAVTMIAPAGNYSGYGAALPPTRTVSYFPYQRTASHPANVTAYGFSGTPASCVQVGLSGAMGGPFDLVVSGINLGANLGRDVFYSGTVGAALTAHLLGVPSIAISLDAGEAGVTHWEAAAWALDEMIRLWRANPEPGSMVFNVNVPNLPTASLSGTLLVALAGDSCLTKYRFSPDPHLENTLAVTRDDGENPAAEPWTDVWAVGLGYIAITPFRAIPDLLLYVVSQNIPPDILALPLPSMPEMAG